MRCSRLHSPKSLSRLSDSFGVNHLWWFSLQYLIKIKRVLTLRKVLFLFGGRWWIRTTEGEASRFTVCPLWPLGKSPIFNLNGAGGRTRTPDLLITNQLLYQLSYTSVSFKALDYNTTIDNTCQAKNSKISK